MVLHRYSSCRRTRQPQVVFISAGGRSWPRRLKKRYQIDQLVINSPFSAPTSYWSYDRESRLFERKEGRRPAGYVVATPGSKAFDDPGVFVELPFVNQIRPRVDAWRSEDYPGVTGVTRRLLEHWNDPVYREDRRFFFCQLETAETLIWLAEAPAAQQQGIDIPDDGGPFQRLCSKMATGSGKTVVMAMVIAWQILNKVTYANDTRFSKNVLIVAPGLTVKDRLRVLVPDNPDGDYYDEFDIVPPALVEKLRLGRVLIRNWHALNWETDEQIAKKKSVDKRGALSDEAYLRDVLGEMAAAHNLLVINDEAHHAWRLGGGEATKGVDKNAVEEATKWIGGLDRIHGSRTILRCYDFTATPFVPSGKDSNADALFPWVVSDFGLNDAIESGLVKTPRVVVRDDGKLSKEYKSRLYHIYMDSEVRSDLSRKAEEHEPLPDLVVNGYYLLGKDWLETAEKWREEGQDVPPVMITVANRTETAARVKYAFDRGKIRIDELRNPDATLHVDSKVLEAAEVRDEALSVLRNRGGGDGSGDRKLTKQEQAELLREVVSTVGQVGRPGELVQNVISVLMLTEGWDAKTVTHIMGLRAFDSQLLCEQVVGRGLRRTSYEINEETGFFEAEYVNIFGVPFTFLPHEGGDGPPPPPAPPKTRIEPRDEKREHEITWPNVLRIDHVYRPSLQLDPAKVKQLTLSGHEIALLAELAPILEGKPDVTRITEIDLEQLAREFRLQKVVFETARDVYDQMKPTWKGNRDKLLAQVIQIVDGFIRSNRIKIKPSSYAKDDLRRRIVITLSMNRVVQHLWEAIRFENTESLELVFDTRKPIRSTADMRSWYTSRPCEITKRSHISHAVFDSRWEANEAAVLDRNPNVTSWVKNDHLGYEIVYVYKGVFHKYYPDFLIRLVNGSMLVLEVDGDLRSVRVDWDRLALGRSIVVRAGIRRSPYTGAGQWDVSDNGTLVYAEGANGDVGYLVEVDVDGSVRPIVPEPDAFMRYDVSHDGSRLAAVVNRPTEQVLLVYDLASGQHQEWVRDPNWIAEPLWRNSDREITTTLGNELSSTWALISGSPTAAAGPDTLLEGTGGANVISLFGHHGDSLAMGTSWPEARIVRVNFNASPPAIDTLMSDAVFGVLSPDERWLAYRSGRSDEIWISPYPGLDQRYRVAAGVSEPQWLSSTELVYGGWESTITFFKVRVTSSGPNPVGEPEVWHTDPRFIDTPGHSFTLTPDGRLVYVQSPEQAPASYLRVIPNWVEQMKRAVAAANR